MLVVDADGARFAADSLPWLAVADAALRILRAGRSERLMALDASWLRWTAPSDELPVQDPAEGAHATPADWAWLRANGPALGVDASPWPTCEALARGLAARRGPRMAIASALSLAAAAAVARAHPAEFSLALLDHAPARWRAVAHPPLDPDPMLGRWSLWADPNLMPGVSGPVLSMALADCARAGRWGETVVYRPDGGVERIPPQVWDELERRGQRGVFEDGFDGEDGF